MTRLRNKISKFVLAVAAAGLLMSLMHYHRAALDCLEHSGEPHYTEYVWVCPVCALHVQVDSDDINTFHAFLQFKEYLVINDDTLPLQEEFSSPLGRSPPAIA